jgi:hypothetical protein
MHSIPRCSFPALRLQVHTSIDQSRLNHFVSLLNVLDGELVELLSMSARCLGWGCFNCSRCPLVVLDGGAALAFSSIRQWTVTIIAQYVRLMSWMGVRHLGQVWCPPDCGEVEGW